MITNVNFAYETMGTTSYLVATFPPDGVIVNYQLQMISSNEIKYLLPVIKRQKNDDIQIFYNITSKIAVSEILVRRKMNKYEFITLLEGAVKAYKEAQEYQLINTGILYDLQYIFIKTDTFEPSFAYLPLYSAENGIESLVGLIQSLILKSAVETTADNFIQVILDTLNSDHLSIEQLETCIKKLKGEKETREAAANPPRLMPVMSVKSPPPQEQLQPSPAPAPAPDVQGRIAVPPAQEHQNSQKNSKKKEKSNKKSERDPEKGKKTFLLIQAAFMIIVSSLISFGFFKDQETGVLLIKNIMAAVIILGAAEFIIYREIFINQKSDKEENKTKSNKKKNLEKKTQKSPVEIPGRSSKKEFEEVDIPSSPVVTPPSAASSAPIFAPVIPQPIPAPTPKVMDETVVLDDGEHSEAYLEYYENGIMTRVMLNKSGIIVGRLAGQVDFIVNTNKVGKMHAEFITQDGAIYVKDLNSKNGTYINGNGQRITNNVLYPIKNGDKITLANSDFILRC